MHKWLHFSSRVTEGITIIGLILLLAISFGITAEVLLRKLFNTSLGGMDELSSYGFAIFTSFAFSVAALSRANIRIDILRSFSPTKVRIALDLINQLALIGFAGLLTWRAFLMVSTSWAKGTKAITPFATPVAWPQTIWLAGLIAFVLILLTMFGLGLRALLRGDTKTFGAFAGPISEIDLPADAPPQTPAREA